jgi:DNA-binding XRE family transcriptional regulator
MARAALNWTVRDLAEATGLHRNTITNIEVGRYAGDPNSISAIKAVLQKSIPCSRKLSAAGHDDRRPSS